MNGFKRFGVNAAKALALPVGLYVLMFVLTRLFGTGQFGTWASLRAVAQQTMVGACVALAMTCNMQNDRWDFSIGMIFILTGIVAAPFAVQLGWGPMGLLLCCVAVGLIAGMINAAAYLTIRVPSIVTSIGLMIAYESIALVYNNGGGAKITDFNMLVFGRPPFVFVLGLAAGVVFYMLYTHTIFGYNARSLARAQALAVSTGINEKRNVFGCYLLCGLMLGVAGTINLSTGGSILASVRLNGANNTMFEAFAPVFIGFYLSQYVNLTIGVFIGAFSIKLLTAGLLGLGISSAFQTVGVGVFLLLFIAFTTNQARISEFRRVRKRIASVNKRNEFPNGAVN